MPSEKDEDSACTYEFSVTTMFKSLDQHLGKLTISPIPDLIPDEPLLFVVLTKPLPKFRDGKRNLSAPQGRI
jgi:hypothetical protein